MANAVAEVGSTFKQRQRELLPRRKRRPYSIVRAIADEIIEYRCAALVGYGNQQHCHDLSAVAFELSRQWANK